MKLLMSIFLNLLLMCRFAFSTEFFSVNVLPLVDEHVHGATLVECPNGDLLAAWFQGSGERWADDVRIMGARLPKNADAWSAPFLMADTPELWPEPFRGTDGTMTLGTFFREFQRLDETEIARIMALNGWSERDLDTVIDATDARLYAHDGFHPRDIADQDVAHWSYAAPECEAQIVHAVDNGVRCVRMTREIAMIFAPTVAGMIANASWMTPEEFIARNDMPPGSTADTELVLDRWYLVAE